MIKDQALKRLPNVGHHHLKIKLVLKKILLDENFKFFNNPVIIKKEKVLGKKNSIICLRRHIKKCP